MAKHLSNFFRISLYFWPHYRSSFQFRHLAKKFLHHFRKLVRNLVRCSWTIYEINRKFFVIFWISWPFSTCFRSGKSLEERHSYPKNNVINFYSMRRLDLRKKFLKNIPQIMLLQYLVHEFPKQNKKMYMGQLWILMRTREDT